MKRVALTILVLGAFASCAFAGCPPAALICSYYHPGSIVTGSCEGDQCLEVNYGGGIKVVAGDDSGDFPRMWFAWHEGTMTLPQGLVPCELREKQLKKSVKTRLEIPEGGARCSVDVMVGEHLYYEHFASNPTSQCLGWVECEAVAP